jgi:hypothetical protein
LPVLEAVGAALGSIKALTDLVGGISNATVRIQLTEKIADLQGSLLKARQEMLEMEDKYEEVVRENRRLKDVSAPKEKPTGKRYGAYMFAGDDGLYCTACYDSAGRKIQTTRLNARFRQCPVCQALLGSG